MLKNILLVGLGGAVGSMLRYLCTVGINKYFPSAFPWATFAINIIGCFLIGVFLALFSREQGAHGDVRLLLMTGLCGGYTTFSAFALENLQLLQAGQTNLAFLYIVASVIMGVLAVWGGVVVVR